MSVKKIYKYVFFKILDIFNIDKRYLKRIQNDKHLVILNLHRVSNDINPFYPSLSPKLFEELLKYITGKFNVITFKEIEKYENSEKPNIILSFDDGFYDFLEVAMPILEKYNVRANLNVIPECMENDKPVWDVMLGDFLNQAPIELINQLKLPNFEMELTETNKSQYGLALTRYLKQKTKKEREELWVSIDTLIHKRDIKFTKMLNSDDIIQISKVHEIGVHSFSHESMALENKTFFERDFFKCKKYFEDELNLPMEIYAFPSGSYENYQIEFLIKNEIQHILLVDEEYANYKTNNHTRFTYYADSKSEVSVRALGWKKI